MYLLEVIKKLSIILFSRIYENVPTLFFPVLYFEQKVTIPDSMTFSLKLLVNFQVICSAIGIILIAAGILILIITCYKICTTNVLNRKNTKTVHIIKEEVPLKQWYFVFSYSVIYRVFLLVWNKEIIYSDIFPILFLKLFCLLVYHFFIMILCQWRQKLRKKKERMNRWWMIFFKLVVNLWKMFCDWLTFFRFFKRSILLKYQFLYIFFSNTLILFQIVE